MLENSLSLIKSALSTVNKTEDAIENETDSIEIILTDLGIISDSGSQDLIKIINTINERRKIDAQYQFSMRDVYYEVLKNNEESNSVVIEKDIRSLEQRIRRIILKSLGNIAQIGLDDFYNPKFMEYATLLFDMKNIKQEMRYLENPTEDRGKINIKKFIKGIITKL
jgi:two-component system response regulator YcbB